MTAKYSNTWALKISGGPDAAHGIASKHGLINRGQVSCQQVMATICILLLKPINQFCLDHIKKTALAKLKTLNPNPNPNNLSML